MFDLPLILSFKTFDFWNTSRNRKIKLLYLKLHCRVSLLHVSHLYSRPVFVWCPLSNFLLKTRIKLNEIISTHHQMNGVFPLWSKLLIVQFKRFLSDQLKESVDYLKSRHKHCAHFPGNSSLNELQQIMFSFTYIASGRAAMGLWFHFQFICAVIKHRSKAIKAARWKTVIANWTKRNKWADWTADKKQAREEGGRSKNEVIHQEM